MAFVYKPIYLFTNLPTDENTAALHLVVNDLNGCIQPINISFFSSYYQL